MSYFIQGHTKIYTGTYQNILTSKNIRNQNRGWGGSTGRVFARTSTRAPRAHINSQVWWCMPANPKQRETGTHWSPGLSAQPVQTNGKV